MILLVCDVYCDIGLWFLGGVYGDVCTVNSVVFSCNEFEFSFLVLVCFVLCDYVYYLDAIDWWFGWFDVVFVI